MRSDMRSPVRAGSLALVTLLTLLGGAMLPDAAVAAPTVPAVRADGAAPTDPAPSPAREATPTSTTSQDPAATPTQEPTPTSEPAPDPSGAVTGSASTERTATIAPSPAPESSATGAPTPTTVPAPAPAMESPSAPRAPTATATSSQYAAIEGEVLSQMDPVGGATVTVLDAVTGRVLRWVVADGSGHYRIDGLAPGAVKVRATKAGFMPSYANGRTTPGTADVYVLQAGQTLSQGWDPMVLYLDVMPEAVVQGQVLSWMDPIAGATVTVLDADTGKVLGSAISDGQGDYRIGMLPMGRVKVRGSMTGHVTSFADSGTSFATARAYALLPGETLSQSWDPMRLYLDIAPEAVIDGTVLGDGVPLAAATVTVLEASTAKVLGWTLTDATGHYRLGSLPTTTVKVRATKGGWLPGFANGRATLAAGDPIQLTGGQTTTNPWLDLEREAAIEGQVLGWMDPLSFATVAVVDARTGRILRTATADTQGEYRIGGLAAGEVKIRATAPGWLPGWADNATTFAAATVYTLQAGQTLTESWDPMRLYLDLTPESAITGSVMGFSNNPDNPWDDPLRGVTVTALDPVTRHVLGWTTTDEFGQFRVGMLPMEKVLLRASKPGWVTSYAGPVQAWPWGWPEPVALSIYEAATIQGQVLGNMDPLGGATVTVLDAVTGKVLGSTVADSSGDYRVTGLPNVDVKVRATRTGWYSGFADGAGTFATAHVFTLVEGVTLQQSWDPMVLYLDLRPRTVG